MPVSAGMIYEHHYLSLFIPCITQFVVSVHCSVCTWFCMHLFMYFIRVQTGWVPYLSVGCVQIDMHEFMILILFMIEETFCIRKRVSHLRRIWRAPHREAHPCNRDHPILACIWWRNVSVSGIRKRVSRWSVQACTYYDMAVTYNMNLDYACFIYHFWRISVIKLMSSWTFSVVRFLVISVIN